MAGLSVHMGLRLDVYLTPLACAEATTEPSTPAADDEPATPDLEDDQNPEVEESADDVSGG